MVDGKLSVSLQITHKFITRANNSDILCTKISQFSATRYDPESLKIAEKDQKAAQTIHTKGPGFLSCW